MIGQTISHYKILEKLGEGGMGVVYKAQDINLNRPVALKFLPPHLSASEQDKARFSQEAQAAAALNHPNICTIYGIEESDGQLFIAMEFVEGQTLRDKTGHALSTAQPPQLKQSIDIGIQLAEGLAAAHEKGIVHRDVKPENIMIQKDGRLRIMDFGLAKLKSASRLTKVGSTVGTTGYMSPEQVQGLESDHRSDIFSLGVILYELFAGQSPFKGVHETAINYEIVNVDPEQLASLKPEISAELSTIVAECMAKEPGERSQSAAEVAKDLRHARRESSKSGISRIASAQPITRGFKFVLTGPRSKSFGYLLSGLLLIALIVAVVRIQRTPTASDRPVIRFSLDLPASTPLFFSQAQSGIAVSPDGKYFVYTAQITNSSQLFLHRMDKSSSEPLAGTENAAEPACSPDGKWVAFNTDQERLSKVSILGGAVELVTPTNGQTRGIWWDAGNTIYYGHISSCIHRVPASGGTPEAVTTLDSTTGEISHRYPQILPDGKTLLYTIKTNNITTFDDAIIAVQRLGSSERKILIRGGTYARFIPSGYLTYVRGNTIYAVQFDASRLELIGSPVPVEEGGWMNGASGQANVGFSDNGLLVYAPSGPLSISRFAISWMDRQGKTHPLLDTLRSYFSARLSPDGQKFVTDINAANDDIWIYNIPRGTLVRMTFAGGNHNYPIWSSDGKFILYAAEKGKFPNIFRKAADGTGSEEQLTNDSNTKIPVAMTPDGKWVTFEQNGDIWVLPMDGERKLWPLVKTPANEHGGIFSPDGHWMAYSSDESGRNEVYVTAFPKRNGTLQISNSGGINPFWSKNGKELFFTNGSSLMGVQVSTGSTFDFAAAKKICEIPASMQVWDITPDGKQFLVRVMQVNQMTMPRLEVVTEWFDRVKSKFSGGMYQ